MKIVLFCALMLLMGMGQPLRAQSLQPAEIQIGVQHFQKQEWEACLRVLEPFLTHPEWYSTAYAYSYACLLQGKAWEEAEKLAYRTGRRWKGSVHYEVDRGHAMRLRGRTEEAVRLFEGLVNQCSGEPNQVMILAGAFRVRAENELAEKTYQRGRVMAGNPAAFAMELADLAYGSGQKAAMIEHYLDYLRSQPEALETVQYSLQQKLEADEMDGLRTALIRRLRQVPDEWIWGELLVWYLVQQKDFAEAFPHARALDLRLREKGRRVLNLARVAIENEDWKACLPMLDYVGEQAAGTLMGLEAQTEKLRVCAQLLRAEPQSQRDSMTVLAQAYQALLGQPQPSANRLRIASGYAELLAFDLGRNEEAMDLLEQIIQQGGESQALGEVKLLLGDLYLLDEIYWEAALVYGQVERDFPNQPLGHQAKFRNARLSFFEHEFAWSLAQFDVLKGSTTTRMANDAMAWSINIHDHYDLDTSTLPLQGLALLDRLVFRREYERALAISDSLLDTLRGHALGDDLYMRRASLLERLGRYAEADTAYGSVLANFGDEVWADDACLRRGGLWETHLGDAQRARDLYEKLMLKYPDSAFVPEARKRIRKIRGDRSPEGSL